ncbi:unannotated protein [freshwater metagenome]|uniref:Unannotated protein n=1 Tax=freshwater metagenome TaxID=449393 RepID=A0A6J7G5Z7_9ZZZZ|nr:hypothetical protein [Actinomycetota bacterium]MSX15512.1 hypothetical protein [Actinomycetota bacterium]MSX35827.1 hypothetical protein [Actinomycetota bacterium]MSX76635.1 hypothetical protein [Actinomycetota bacterium]MSZ70892.1 hypothetical protein [Actinomycetota bacterium]
MGLIRKIVSGSAAVATGGLSLGVIQFRSDTERGTRQTKLSRQAMEREHQESMELQRRQMISDEAEMIAIQQSRSVAMARNTAVQQSAPQIAQNSHHVAQSVPEVNISDRLEDIARLASLRDSGVLTEEEFESEKAVIIRLIQ